VCDYSMSNAAPIAPAQNLMPLPPPKGLTAEQIEAAEAFALATGIAPPRLFETSPSRRPPHVGACRCPRCKAPNVGPARATPARQPWEPRAAS
jgi:hypothetical protein